MLKQTFIHIPGVGPKTEQLLWSKGLTSWDAFDNVGSESKLPARLRDNVAKHLELSREALGRQDIDFFARTLPTSQHWRLYEQFADQFVFLDIETTGLSRYYDEVTLGGLFYGHDYRVFLSGHSLESLPEALEPARGVVTFNGALFDLPFLRQTFRDIRFPSVHIDLRFLLRRLGIRGGLKAIESSLGVERPGAVEDLGGYEATVLWHRYRRGDVSALERLVEYNYFDVVNLKALLDFALAGMSASLPGRRGQAQQNGERPHLHQPIIGSGSRNGRFEPSKLLSAAARNGKHHASALSIQNLLPLIPSSQARVVGIDLAAAEGRRNGWAALEGPSVKTATFETDKQLVEAAVREQPHLVSIDAPLSIPRGRDCTDDSCQCRSFGIMRECERELKRRGLNVYPCLLPSMSALTERGIALARTFGTLGIPVIESYPGAAQDILRIPRKKASLADMRLSLNDMGFEGRPLGQETSHDELDAMTAALVGYLHLAGQAEALGDAREGCLFVPSKEARNVLMGAYADHS